MGLRVRGRVDAWRGSRCMSSGVSTEKRERSGLVGVGDKRYDRVMVDEAKKKRRSRSRAEDGAAIATSLGQVIIGILVKRIPRPPRLRPEVRIQDLRLGAYSRSSTRTRRSALRWAGSSTTGRPPMVAPEVKWFTALLGNLHRTLQTSTMRISRGNHWWSPRRASLDAAVASFKYRCV